MAGVSLGLGEWAALLPISPASAAEAEVTPELVRFGPDIEPIVRLIENTPREKCPAMMIERLRKGLPFRQFLAALYLANIRTGEVDHPLAVLHSTNQLTLDLPVQERLLPTIWAMDSFKFHRERAKAAPSLRPLAGQLPSAAQAEEEFHAGMNKFDGERAERAIVAVIRSQGSPRVAELLWRYAARDWTFIGHFAIWVANVWRTLETIGWQYAESSLRVVATSIVGQDKTLQGQPYWANRERVQKAFAKIPANWAEAGSDVAFTKELIAAIRETKAEAACDLIVNRLLTGKVRAGAVWDAVHLSAGEMFMCAQKNPEPLHANTAANALHYLFESSGDTANRLLILLQAVGWMCLYRAALVRKGWLREPRQILDLKEAAISETPEAAVEEILAHLSFGADAPPTSDPFQGTKGPDFNNQPWRHKAASKAFAFARKFSDPQPLVHAAWRLLPLKADWDPHRIKFPVATWENWHWVSAEWRPHMLAAASYSFVGADAPDTDLAKQVREAVRNL
jgi:hypothetical protein